MKHEIKVPAMGESISEATVSAILKPAGAYVQMDDELLELATDKVNQVLYAPKGGVLSLDVQLDQRVVIGQLIGTIDDAGAASVATPAAPPSKSPSPILPAPEVAAASRPSASAATVPDKPKKTSLDDAGQWARISPQDFVAELKKPSHPIAEASTQETAAPAAAAETRRKMSQIRKVIASRLVQVQQTTAMLTTFNEVDLTEVMSLREKYKERFLQQHDARLGLMSFFVLATVAALKKFPDVNSYIDGDELVQRNYYNIGIAVGTPKGLVVPVIKGAERLSMAGVEKAIGHFAIKVKEGKLTADELTGGGFTITNGGVYGSLLSTPILPPQQCAILGMHKIAKRPVVIDDAIVIRQMMYLALSYDHRIIDGKEAVSFLVEIKNLLEDPARMLLDI
jgi:2-oxoglutarate dehydrogenase E2 component (dihydrolipoamide succinyltransferase)